MQKHEECTTRDRLGWELEPQSTAGSCSKRCPGSLTRWCRAGHVAVNGSCWITEVRDLSEAHNGGPATDRRQSWRGIVRDEGTVQTGENIHSVNKAVIYPSTGPARGHPEVCTRDPCAAQTANVTAQSSFSTWLLAPLSLSELWKLVLLHRSQHFAGYYIELLSKREDVYVYFITSRENCNS